MCYSLELSSISLTVGLLGCYLLVRYSRQKYTNTNKAIAIFFAFVYLMQLIELMLWADTKCTNGLNRIASSIGPLLNHFQPVILLIVSTVYLKSANVINQSFVYSVNVIYSIYTVYMYGKYIADEQKHGICTGINAEGHLDWPWKNYFQYVFYLLLIVFNVINYYNNGYLVISLIVSFGLLYISSTNYKKNVGEFWCLMVVSVPYLILLLQLVRN
jgi:hypothetical protein